MDVTSTSTRTPDLVEMAVLEVALVPGGIHRSVLWAAVAARMAELDPGAPPPQPDRVLRALGMCIVRGQVDEVGGRVLPVAALRGQAESASSGRFVGGGTRRAAKSQPDGSRPTPHAH